MDQVDSLRKLIASSFKLHGLTLRSDGASYLVDVLYQLDSSDREPSLDKLIDITLKLPLTTTFVDKNICEQAVRDCNADLSDQVDRIFTVIDAFRTPKFVYSNERKKYLPVDLGEQNLNLPIFGDANSKADVFRERYINLYQRTCRHELFTPLPIGAVRGAIMTKKFQLKPVEYLLGSTVKLGEIIVLGMLTPLKEGKWYLEDVTGAVEVDLKGCAFHTGLFTDGCFVLAEGWYEDEVFHVTACGFPPAEPAKLTRSFFGNINFFGGPLATCAKASEKLARAEQDNAEAMIVFLSDVWLDCAKVMERLQVLLQGYVEQPPYAFVFCGPFLLQPNCGQAPKALKDCLKQLADAILQHRSIARNSKFVFVPGSSDPGMSTILPRPPIPSFITQEFCATLPNAVFSSNPCRLQYCTRDIVVFREDVVTKMCRNCVRFPADGDVPTHFAKSITCQGHLSPLPLHVSPVYWPYDQALRLYPLPDLIVCADKFDSFSVANAGCTVMNPGSFPRSDFCFKVYFPATDVIEDSKVPA